MLKLSKAVSEENPSEDVSPKIHGFTYHCLPEVLQAAYQTDDLRTSPSMLQTEKRRAPLFCELRADQNNRGRSGSFVRLLCHYWNCMKLLETFLLLFMWYIVHSIFNALAVAEAWKAVAPSTCEYQGGPMIYWCMSTNTFWKRITFLLVRPAEKSCVSGIFGYIRVWEYIIMCVLLIKQSINPRLFSARGERELKAEIRAAQRLLLEADITKIPNSLMELISMNLLALLKKLQKIRVCEHDLHVYMWFV